MSAPPPAARRLPRAFLSAALALLPARFAGAWGAYYHKPHAPGEGAPIPVSTAAVVFNGESTPAASVTSTSGGPAAVHASASSVASSTAAAAAAAAGAGSLAYVQSGGLQLANPTAGPNPATQVGGGVNTSGGYPPNINQGGGGGFASPSSNDPAAGAGFGAGQTPTQCDAGTHPGANGGCVACPAGTHPDNNGACLPGDGGSSTPPIATHQRVY
jgi:hypothetical protein